MKALKVIVAAGLLLAAKQASAFVDISAFGGYTTLGMTAVNSNGDKYATLISGKNNPVNSGFYAGGDVGFSTFPFLKIGPRVEYVQAGQGVVTHANGDKSTLDTSLLLMEAGLTVDTALPGTGLSVIGGLWGGYGLAGSSRMEPVAGVPVTTLGNGSGFVGEVAAQLRYGIVAGLSIGLDLGYRMANITNMAVSSDVGAQKKGDPFDPEIGNSSNGVAFDYSGLNAGGAISFNF